MLKEELKFENSTILEGMTSISALFKAKEMGINDRRIETVLFDGAKAVKNSRKLAYLKAMSEKYGFEMQKSDSKTIEKYTLGTSHGGIIALCSPRTISALTASHIKPEGFYVMIQGIEDPYNFGYALRSLYACGCEGVILPERNWMGAAGVVARSSAGASELFPMFTSNAEQCADIFKSVGYRIVAADERSDTYVHNADLKAPILLIVGGEKRGISRALVDKCDKLLKINYGRAFNESLSAASASTILAYEIMIANLK